MANTKAIKDNSVKTTKTAKAVSKSKVSTVDAEAARQRAAIKRILYSHDSFKTCNCGCGFQWVPAGYKVKGMEELLDNINPKHELGVLKLVNSYLKGCVEDDIPVNRKELENLVAKARGEETYDEEEEFDQSEVNEDFLSFDDMRYSATIDDLEVDEFAA